MKVVTSSWSAAWAGVKEAGAVSAAAFVPVSISCGAPRFWKGGTAHLPKLRELAPYGLMRIPEPEFGRRYVDRLDGFGVDLIRDRLSEVWGEHEKPLALLCFEKDVRACHRGSFSLWWAAQTGEVVTESDLTPAGLEHVSVLLST